MYLLSIIKRIFLILLVAFIFICSLQIVFVLGWFLIKSYEERQYFFTYSQKNGYVLTRIQHGGETYFYNGFYNLEKIPNEYVQPLYSGWSGSYSCNIYWKNDTCYVAYYTGDWEIVGSPKLKLKKLTLEESIEMIKDSSRLSIGGGAY